MKFNVGKYKFTFFRMIVLAVLMIGMGFLYTLNPYLFVVALCVCIGGMFNGNADCTNFSWNQIIWRRVLKGKLLKWFEDEYDDYLASKWWVHPMFWDGWHFLKNMWVLSLLTAIGFSLYYTIVLNGTITIIFIIWCAYVWMVGKEMWHHHMARASFWGFPDTIPAKVNVTVKVGKNDAGELSPMVFKHLQEKANER